MFQRHNGVLCPACEGSGQILFGHAGWQTCPYCVEFRARGYSPGYVDESRYTLPREEQIGKAWWREMFEKSTIHEHEVPPSLQLFPPQEQHLGHALQAIERPRQHARPLPPQPVGRVRHFTGDWMLRYRTGPRTKQRRYALQVAFVEAMPALKQQQVARERAKTRLLITAWLVLAAIACTCTVYLIYVTLTILLPRF